MDDFDLDLLLSVAGGLGRWQEHGSRRVYVKDDDCLGEAVLGGTCCSQLWQSMKAVGHLGMFAYTCKVYSAASEAHHHHNGHSRQLLSLSW